MVSNTAPMQDGDELQGGHSSCRSHVFSPTLAEKGAQSIPLLSQMLFARIADAAHDAHNAYATGAMTYQA
jgi:hypothetical protein